MKKDEKMLNVCKKEAQLKMKSQNRIVNQISVFQCLALLKHFHNTSQLGF